MTDSKPSKLPPPSVSMSSRGLDHETGLPSPDVSDRRSNPRRGLFIVVDGLDGIGKGEIERALRGYEERLKKAVFDVISFSRANEELPELEDFWGTPRPHYNTIMTAEPTYVGIGRDIRNELIVRNGRNYSARLQIEAYSLDRLIQMKRVVVPAIEHGLNVIQSRCVASTLTYQMLKAMDEGKNSEEVKWQILNHEGNVFQLVNAPDLLLIPTIKSVEQLQQRLRERGRDEKEDAAEFENAAFQGRLKPLYESSELRELFEKYGTKVAYLNAGLGIEDSRRQAVDVYRTFLESGKERKIPDWAETPDFVDAA